MVFALHAEGKNQGSSYKAFQMFFSLCCYRGVAVVTVMPVSKVFLDFVVDCIFTWSR